VRDRAELKSQEYLDKVNEGPVMVMTVFGNGPISMGRSLLLWAIYCLFISALAACVTCSILPVGADGHAAFHYTAIIAFSCYTVGLWQTSIWYGRPWSTTLKSTIDGIIYACITGAIFMWLWPAG
jgi:hypothetical protein